MKKRLSAILQGLIVLALIGGAILWWKDHQRQKAEDAKLKFETSKVERGRLTAKVTASGTLSPLVTVLVGSQVSGRIKEIHADFNSIVKKGDVLARIDPQLFIAAREQARANQLAAQSDVTSAKVRALDAQRQYDRSKGLSDRKLIAQADLDTAQANADAAAAAVDSARGRLEQAKASLHQAEVNIDYTTIECPIDGIVISRAVDVGQTVASSMQTPTLFTVAEDLKKMQVDTSVAEADIGKLSPGMKVAFTVDAYPSERFPGKVRQIRNAATTVQNVVTYDAVIDVENPDGKLKPGMTANVSFVYADVKDVLHVPNAALRFRPPAELTGSAGAGGSGAAAASASPGGGFGNGAGMRTGRRSGGEEQSTQRKVWRLEGGTPKQVSVTVGVSDGSATEIVGDSLKEGDLVVIDATGGSTDKAAATGAPGAAPAGGAFRRMF